MLDFLIQNATVYSGLTEPARVRDVGIAGDKIVVFDHTAQNPLARQVIDGAGMILAPGFIDPHASTGFGYFFPKAADHKLHQGITTEIFGNCGTSPAPVGPNLVATMERLSEEIGFPFEWRTLSEYFDRIADKLQFNIATLVGHSTLRGGYMQDWKSLSPEQLQHMKDALAQAMREGALGFSTGLIYAPGCFAELDELVQLARVAAEAGGVYASHIRDERNNLEEAVAEALTISEQAGIRALVSHLKAAERPNWGKIPRVIEQIERFNAQHPEHPAAIDVYPYTAISTKLRAFIPKQLLQDGIDQLPAKLGSPAVRNQIAQWIAERAYDLHQMLVISDENEAYFGKTIGAIAEAEQKTAADAISEILMQSTETWVVYHCIDQRDIDAAICWKHAMICTDSWSYPINAPRSIGQPHPRSYGAFTAYLERYVLDTKMLSWQEAIYKITCLPARFFGLTGRGQIEQGYFADLVLLDPATLKAHATYTHPKSLSEGVRYLWVNGQLVIDEGKTVDNTHPGRVLGAQGKTVAQLTVA